MREDSAPVWDVNEWIASDPRWADVVKRAGASSSNIFYPVQQDPESGFPYVRYSSTIYTPAHTYWFHRNEIMYAMYFNNTSHSNAAMNIIIDKVSAGDKSGAALERWRQEQAQSDPIYDAFTYHSAEWIAGGSEEPAGERGGAHARLLTFRVFYSPNAGTHVA